MKKTRRFLHTAITALIISALSVLFAVPSFAAASTGSSEDSFSLFGLSTEQLIIGAAVIVVVVILLIIIFKPKKKKGNSIAETESVSEPEEKAEEATDTEVTESAEVTEGAAEVVSETAPAAEEAISEEAAEPESAVSADEPTAEVAQTEEAAAEPETVTETVTEAVTEEAAAEPAPVPTEAVDPETGCTYTFDEKGIPVAPDGMIIRYKWSFLGRLIQSDNIVKYRYMTLRRMLLAYSKVRSNVSWNYDSYFVGKKQIAKMKIRGKNLVVYFPIDPKTMEGTKYIGEDVSKVSRYKAVPFAYRINGNRKMKYAMELIAQLLEGVPTEAPEYNVNVANANSAIPFEDFDTLYLKGYVKIGGFLAVTRASSASDDDDEDEATTVAQTVVEDDDDDTEALPLSAVPVEKEVFNFNPKKK